MGRSVRRREQREPRVEVRDEEAVWGLPGALEAKPEVGILVPEIIKCGGVALRPGRGGGVEWEKQAQKDVGTASSTGALGHSVHTVSRRHGDPPRRLPLGRGPSPGMVAGSCTDNGSQPWGMGVSAQLST